MFNRIEGILKYTTKLCQHLWKMYVNAKSAVQDIRRSFIRDFIRALQNAERFGRML